MGTLILSKVHNFGIYRKGGKRCILQLDFPARVVLIIQKGRIKKTQNFDGLKHYDSEEGLRVSLKFGNTEIDFEADNTEEKCTICRLLGCILHIVHGGDNESLDSDRDLPSLGAQQTDRSDVIKEGILDKKGSGTLTTWKKRKVRLVPGEFTYYKPGQQLVLNIVQLRQEIWEVTKLGQNGFTVRIRDRVYSFRVPSEYKAQYMTEIVRNEWMLAFHQAFSATPFSANLFDQSLNGSSISDDPEHIYDVTPDMCETVPVAVAHDRMQVPGNSHSSGEITAHVTLHLNYIDKGVPVPRKTFDTRWSSDKPMSFTQDKQMKQTEPSCGYSDVAFVGNTSSDSDSFTGSAAALREKLEKQGGKSSSLKAYRAQHDFHEHGCKSNTSGHSVLRSYFSDDGTLQIRQQAMPNDDKKLSFDVIKDGFNKSNTESTNQATCLVIASSGNQKPSQKGAKRILLPPPPLIPSSHNGNLSGIPSPPPGAPPPLPSLIKNHNSSKVKQTPNIKLKQVHWVKVNNNQIAASLWRDANDMTNMLDLTELEEHFSIQEKKTVAAKPKLQEDKQMLIDAKRAQNLGILFCGLKPENISKLADALRSATELEHFPTDKMATLKRYQPTTEDKEMYKAYSNKQDSLHHVDRFMLKLCEIPCLSLRLDFTLTLWEFPDHYAGVEEEVNDLLSGCEEILTSNDLITVLEYLLAIGNYMNALWSAKQGVQGFQISSIEKILSVKSHNSQATLCTYLVKQIKRNQPDLLNWPHHLSHVPKCSGYSIKAVGAEIDVLKNDLQKIKKILKTLRSQSGFEDKTDKKFEADVQNFILEYDYKMEQMDIRYTKVTDKYKQLLVKFGEPPNKMTESVFSYVNFFIDKFRQASEKVK